MEKVRTLREKDAPPPAAPLKLPKSIPTIDDDVAEGACRRSARARRLDATLRARADAGKVLGERDVDKLVRTATTPDGKVDGDQAVVLARHAQRNPKLFAGGHGALLRFLARVSWRSLVRDLAAFIAQVREEEAEARKREEIRQSIEDDRVEQDTRRAQIKKTTAADDDRRLEDLAPTPADDALSADTRLRRTLERMKRG